MTVDCTSVTFVEMSVVIKGGRGMIFFVPTATQWQACPVLMAAVALAAGRIGFLFQLGLRKKTEGEIVVGKMVFGYWQRSARKHQKKIATVACALVTTTEKGQMFSNTQFLNYAVRNMNQNMRQLNLTQNYRECRFAPEFQ